MITKKQINDAIKKFNIKGKCIILHSSLKSFGDVVEGGPLSIINVFIDNGCTLITPTFSYEFLINPPEGKKYSRNGYDYSVKITENREIFTTNSDCISKNEMGIIPYTMLHMKERIRGYHPVCSFTGIGPFASEIIKTQKPMDVFAPLRELALFNGYILLLGVNLNKLTALHLAEQMAGRNMFIRWALNTDGLPMEVECGGCSEGFLNLDIFFNGIDKKITIGKSLWRLFPIGSLLKKTARIIQITPQITHCHDIKCIKCADMIAGGPEKYREMSNK